MKLVRRQFKAFSQGSDINADINQGWCAGVTALVSEEAGSYSIEQGLTTGQWAQNAYERISAALDNINSQASLSATGALQRHLGKVKDEKDVCGKIHEADFNGRGCKILLSATGWLPLVGYISYVWNSKWVVNHIGYLVRAGNSMLIFDPNYGLGLFEITDKQPLTLKDLTNAVMNLAWASSVEYYYTSYTTALAVIDEDSMGARFSYDMIHQVDELIEEAKKWNV